MEYGRARIGFTVENRPTGSATTMTDGKKAIKERILLIAKRSHRALAMIIAVIFIGAVAVGCTFTGSRDEWTDKDKADTDKIVSEQEEYNVTDTYDIGAIMFEMHRQYSEKVILTSTDSGKGVAFYMKTLQDKYSGSDMGWLFSIEILSRGEYEEYLMSDGSGVSTFAVDGGSENYDRNYYCFCEPTDVRFDEETGKEYLKLEAELSESIKASVLSMNNLTDYSDSEFWSMEYTYAGNHIELLYYPYNDYNGTKDVAYTLTLSQPVKQGDSGIWCVERWSDGNYTYCWFEPYNGESSQAYYDMKQEQADAGKDKSLLTPLGAAKAFVSRCFMIYEDGREPSDYSFSTVADT